MSWIVIVAVIASCFYCPSGFSDVRKQRTGGWSSGGGGLVTDEGNPWFLGEEPIPYCVSVALNFPIAKEQVSREIREAFAQWKKVFQSYGLYQKYLPGRFDDGKSRYLTIDATELSVCDDKAHQLEFKIGTVDQDVSRYFETQSEDAVGLAQHKEYDHETFRTGGYIWIAPDAWVDTKKLNTLPVVRFPVWEEKPTRLRSILLHEIGHVLGLPHLSGTVMDETIFSHLIYDHWFPAITMRPVSGQIETDTYSLNPFLIKKEVSFEECGLALKLFPGSEAQEDCRDLRITFVLENGVNVMKIASKSLGSSVSTELFPSVGNWQNQPPYQAIRFFSPKYQPARSAWDIKSEDILTLFDGTTVLKGASRTGAGTFPVQVRFNATLTIELFDVQNGWVQYEAASPSL